MLLKPKIETLNIPMPVLESVTFAFIYLPVAYGPGTSLWIGVDDSRGCGEVWKKRRIGISLE